MSIARKLYRQAFEDNPYRDPRSEAYKEGVLRGLEFMSGEATRKPSESIPYRIGTAEADAWFSGLQEGRNRWRIHAESEKERA